MGLMLTPATSKDIKKVFDWRNSPDIVSAGNNQTVIWDEHKTWFAETLADENKFLLIVDNCGAVRLEREGKQAEISIYISEHRRGEGLGRKAIKEATRLAFATWEIDEVIATIKWGNKSSHDAFYDCGYLHKYYDKENRVNQLVNREK